MYDSLTLWHRGASMEVSPLLSRVAEHQRGDSYYITGDLQNLNVVLTDQGASIKGSLAKWYLNDNMQTLTRSDTQRAIEQLSDTLHLPIHEAKVTRTDIAHNFIMDNKPVVYYPYLGDCQHFKRFAKSTSLYYENGNKTKLFYDKIAEVKFRGIQVHDILQNQNLLRFELRFMQRLDKAFNVPEVTAQMLYDETFYMGIIDRWVSEYKTINKLTKMAFKESVQLEPKDFMNQILLQSINSLGGQTQIFELIEEARKRGQFKRPEYASRTKAMIKDLCQLDTLTEPSELVQELDRKIKQVQTYYR
jgi:hypothetical protein